MWDEHTEFIGSNWLILEVFLSEIERHHHSFTMFIREFQAQLANKNNRNMQIFWECIYGALNSTAQVSMILKPSENIKRKTGENPKDLKERKKFSIERGLVLRSLLNVPNEHPILNKELRNRFVHIDEDIDYWWRTSEKRNIIRHSLFAANQVNAPGLFRDEDTFERYDPNTGNIFFLGEKFEFITLVNSFFPIYEKVPKLKGQIRQFGMSGFM